MISVLLATYNGKEYLNKAIESVLCQTQPNLELLIGFNGTTDNSKDIALSYNDGRIKIFDYDDKGKSKTLNKLIHKAQYDIIAIQDDDDIWEPTKIEEQLKHIENYDVVGSLVTYIDENGTVIGHSINSTDPDEIIKLSLNGQNKMANSSTILKKKDAIEIGGWRQEFDGIEDYDLWLRLMRNNKKFFNIQKNLVRHRLHGKSNFNTKKHDLSKIL